MTMFREWGAQWGIPFEAILDLERRSGLSIEQNAAEQGASESRIQSQIRLAAKNKGMILMRNNVGALKDSRGVPVRYGLMNDSKAMNEAIKSADLIGIETVLITQAMVGTYIGRFASVEVKEADWTYSGDAHELAQLAWLNFVNSRGGRAIFANSVDCL